ncbi:Crp/Fnr family transcriptional regulator [Dyadobacter luteus]|uniref:Crp/Fnr family transcriptional regulator n=1 Tax=Dyadobacter luteus TaxID=2259619 RepID=A0A3D8Y2X8_9BACT|nr:Crp/Fnr family transcriptional regulator [Dyadobacter luteus]REA56124.1 Crp/Fnr family transcriptional regulator [Dyadobacter luteus]
MIEVLFSHIEAKVSLTDNDREMITSFFVPKKLRKRQYLLQEGDVCKNLTFIAKGLIRTYNVDEKGDEHMSVFGWEGWWLSDFNSFLTGEPAVFNIDAIEDSELLLISRADYEALTLAVPVMDRYFRILYQNSIVTKERRLMSSITHTAEEKYVKLAESNPEMIQRVPQNLIASYLGIAPETLSRIKKNLVQRKL